MTIPDCYFFVDEEDSEEERKMSVMHVECRDAEMPGVGWLYRGSVEGYGPYDYECAICGELIYAGKQGLDDKKEAETTS